MAGLAGCPRHFSMIAVCETKHILHCHDIYHQPPSTAVYTNDGCRRLYTVLYDIIKQHMDRSVRKPNSTRRSGTDVFMCLMDMNDAFSPKDA